MKKLMTLLFALGVLLLAELRMLLVEASEVKGTFNITNELNITELKNLTAEDIENYFTNHNKVTLTIYDSYWKSEITLPNDVENNVTFVLSSNSRKSIIVNYLSDEKLYLKGYGAATLIYKDGKWKVIKQ